MVKILDLLLTSGVIWIIIIVVAIIIEALTYNLTTTWFAIGGIFGWLIYLTGANLFVQIVVFLLVSILLLLFARPFAVNVLKIGKVKTNADRLIGKAAIVLVEIDNNSNRGQIKVDGQIWSAKTKGQNKIKKNSNVIIQEIVGVKVVVDEYEEGMDEKCQEQLVD